MRVPANPRTVLMNSNFVSILLFTRASIIITKSDDIEDIAEAGPAGPHEKALVMKIIPTRSNELPTKPIQNCFCLNSCMYQYGIANINRSPFTTKQEVN